jgi:hypothetical protein
MYGKLEALEVLARVRALEKRHRRNCSRSFYRKLRWSRLLQGLKNQ